MEALSEQKRIEIRDQAWAYYQRGWTVIPTKGKQPTIRWGKYQKQRPAEAELAEWFGQSSDFDGVAVILGSASGGLACRDFDDEAAYQVWASSHPALARTLPTVRTHRGFHVYFRPENEGYESFPDGEYRADSRHYCVLPPSRHPRGSFYSWLIPLQDELPVIDPRKEELCPSASASDTQRAQRTQKIQKTQKTPKTQPPPPPPSCPELSGCSVSSVSLEPFGPEVEEAISQTLPSGPGQRNRCLFKLARRLKALASYADADPRSLKPTLREWHRRALPFILTKSFDETWFDWLNAWPQIKYPAGTGPLEKALRSASERPLPPAALQYDDTKLQLLVALVAELQRLAGEQPFFLSCRSAGKLVGVGHTKANVWLRGLVADKVLGLVSIGKRKTKKASEYRYLVDLPPC